jgi:hypothetical protein
MLKNFFWDSKQPADEREALIFAEAQARSIRVSALAVGTLVWFISRFPHTITVPLWATLLACVLFGLIGTTAGYTVIRKHDVVLKPFQAKFTLETWSWGAVLMMTAFIQPAQQTMFFGASAVLFCILTALLVKSKKSHNKDFFGHALLSVVLFVAYIVLGILVTSPSLL